jgi:hypothetical protein
MVKEIFLDGEGSRVLTVMDIIKQISNFFAVDIPDESFDVQQIGRIGIHTKITAMAYDSVLSLIAVGTETGDCYIMGKLLDIKIPTLSETAIRKIAFKSGEGLLIGFEETQVLLWNLNNLNLSMAVSFSEPILDIQLSHGSPWFIIAFDSGKVNLMDSYSSLQ